MASSLPSIFIPSQQFHVQLRHTQNQMSHDESLKPKDWIQKTPTRQIGPSNIRFAPKDLYPQVRSVPTSSMVLSPTPRAERTRFRRPGTKRCRADCLISVVGVGRRWGELRFQSLRQRRADCSARNVRGPAAVRLAGLRR